MKNSRFSFGNLFDQSQISKIAEPITQKRASESQQSYKQKYLQSKENIKKFMQMVEKQFQELSKKHNAQKQALRTQISELKRQLNEKSSQVSNFTARSKKFLNTQQKSSHQNRTISQQGHSSEVLGFQSIEGFDQSKIHSRSKSIVDKNFSTLSTPCTLIELQNALGERKSSRVSSKTSIALGNLTQNDIRNNSHNLHQYSSQVLGQRKSMVQESKKKENFDALMEKMMEKSISSEKKKQASFFKVLQQSKQLKPTTENQKNPQRQNNKQNIPNPAQTKNCASENKNKSQQASVRNILKNLRNTMKTNIEKQSNLEATTALSGQ